MKPSDHANQLRRPARTDKQTCLCSQHGNVGSSAGPNPTCASKPAESCAEHNRTYTNRAHEQPPQQAESPQGDKNERFFRAPKLKMIQNISFRANLQKRNEANVAASLKLILNPERHNPWTHESQAKGASPEHPPSTKEAGVGLRT